MTFDPIDNALQQMQGLGLLVDRAGLDIDGKMHRVDVDGQKRGKKAGWYVCQWFNLDDGGQAVVGSFGVWSGNENNAQKISLRGIKIDGAARERLKEQQRQLRAQNEAAEIELTREVGERAAGIWKGLRDLQHPTPYLERKKAGVFGLRVGRDGVSVMPLCNTAGVICQLQFIDAEGNKRFLSGPGKKGAFHLIGDVSEEYPLLFVEGYSTGASAHMATGWPVVVCVDAGNLMPVAVALRLVYPAARFLFAGDDDHERRNPKTGEPENAGRSKAMACAERFGALVAFPRFTDPAGKTDWNDLHVAEGLDIVRAQLLAAYTPTAPALTQEEADQPWSRELVWGDKGLKPMVHNLMLVFEHHPDWRGLIALDIFAQRIVKRRSPPWGGQPGPLTDADEIQMAAWFGRRQTFGVAVPTPVAHEAAAALAERNPYHPVREYLAGLQWDGTQRLETFFADFCNAKNDEVTQAFGRNFFISAVARVMKPGCKADLMLVLEGGQGARKSTLAEALAGSGWYVDVGTSPDTKDFFQLIQGCWLVEISEMAAFSKTDSNHIKRAISVATDKFRSPYGRNPESYPRQCIFFGTSNDSDWQRDATGGRRYMPITVSDVDIEAVRSVRDQLWAEAYARFNAGENWYELPEAAKEDQDERYLEDIWAEPVVRWLEGKGAANRYATGVAAKIKCTTVFEILYRALEMDPKKADRAAQTRVGQLMRRLGWIRVQKRSGGTRVWQYKRPGVAEADEDVS